MAVCNPLWPHRRQYRLTRSATPPLGPQAIAAIETVVGHKFSDQQLLVRALTHSSAATGDSYERLEFLGDRVLGLVLADHFFHNCTDDDQGGLSLRLHAAARQSSLAEVAEALNIAAYVHTQSNMDVAQNPSVLADVVESIVAALYLDAGFEVASAFIKAHIPLNKGVLTAKEKDAKSRLQELVLQRGLALPRYDLVEKSGPEHAPIMCYQVVIDGFDPVLGTAGSRKIAEQNAAMALLEILAKADKG